MTAFNTSSHLMIPCAEVLSVAGFLASPLLFPWVIGVSPGPFCLPVYPWFLTFLTFLIMSIRTCQDSQLCDINRTSRRRDVGMCNTDQGVNCAELSTNSETGIVTRGASLG